MPSKNPEILKKHRDAWYRKNKSKQISRQLTRRKELFEWLRKYKRGLSCSKCGMKFDQYPECCDFHHRDRAKKEGLVSVKVRSSHDAMMKELKKCDPVCANCHRILHAVATVR